MMNNNEEDNSAISTNIRLHAIIKGRVQGVGFRAFTQRKAVENNLTGWVRNRWNGSVETVAEGSRFALERFLKSLQRGPFSGTTREVKYDWQQTESEFQSFHIRRTG
jgi:acylphosphatase